jgi:hypothetical protein
MSSALMKSGGAGEGNRTLVVSLGSFCSTIELHPRMAHFTRVLKFSANQREGGDREKCRPLLPRGDGFNSGSLTPIRNYQNRVNRKSN